MTVQSNPQSTSSRVDQHSYSDLSSPAPAVGSANGTPARRFSEPLRELSALVLLAGNAVFLFLGVSRLLFRLDNWGSEFGLNAALAFPMFVGLVSLGLPMAALLLATHVSPMVPRARTILIAVGVEYGVSALFGAVTFLGAFAYDLESVRRTIEGLLERGVWLSFLVFACVLVVRIWLGLFPPPKPQPVSYGVYAQPTYGQPYPGQPMYPQPTYQVGAATPTAPNGFAALEERTLDGTSGWPPVPPPPMPGPLVIDPDATARMTLPDGALDVSAVETGGDATQIMPAPRLESSPHVEPPTQTIDLGDARDTSGSEPKSGA